MKSSSTFTKVVVFGCILVGFTACKGKEEAKPSEYYYYPKTNMYFDVAKNIYIFSLDGAKTWDTIDAKTQNEPITLGDKIVLYGSSDSIWKDNDAHRRAYKGKLYDVLADDTTDVPVTTIITEKKIVKKTTPVKKEEEEVQKPRKGLGKFLNKIFGKKKDKKENTDTKNKE
jgi:hypothetical protein